MGKDKETVSVAKFIIAYYNNLGEPITQLKLHKLLYYLQAWYLVHFDGKKIFNEEPEAWLNGPVYPSVYKEFPSKKSSPLKVSLLEDTFQSPIAILEKHTKEMDFDEKEAKVVNAVLNKYGRMQDLLLVYTTHEELPWIEARENLPPFARSNKKISLDTMRSYYGNRLEAAKKIAQQN